MEQNKIKLAEEKYPIHDLIKSRWSPVVFDEKPIDHKDIMSAFEAARWAPSSRNEQPWRYIYGHRGDETFSKLLDCLMPGNQVWAKNAAVLIASLSEKYSSHNGAPMKHYLYDTGAANALLQIQALSKGIYSHSMGGFYPEKLVEKFNIPANLEPAAFIALGYLGNIENADEELKSRDLAKRERFEMDRIILNK